MLLFSESPLLPVVILCPGLAAVGVGMSILTTLIAPPLLRILLLDDSREPHPEAV